MKNQRKSSILTMLYGVALVLVAGCANPSGSSNQVAAVSVPALVAHYDFESVVSGALAPVAGTKALPMALTLGSSAAANQLVTGKVGSYALQAGTSYAASTQGGVITGALLNQADTALTVSAWVKATSNWSAFFKFGGMWVALPNFWIPAGTALASNYWLTPGAASLDQDYAWDLPETGYTATSLATGSWVHVTLVFDPAVGISYYKDGALMLAYRTDSCPDAATIVTYVVSNAKSSTNTVAVAFNGASWDPVITVDDLRFYNYALTAAQAAELYATYP